MSATAVSAEPTRPRQRLLHSLALALTGFGLLLGAAPAASAADAGLIAAVSGTGRSADATPRDRYRHPLETLSFFGVKPNMTVVEIWPGSGWYTEILAPYLRNGGQYYAAGPAGSAADASQAKKNAVAKFAAKLAEKPALYSRVQVTEFGPPTYVEIAPEGTADMVLTFRNVHNWIAGDYEQQAFEAFYNALKPGGVLGVVEHRAKPDTTIDQMKKSGYVSEDYIKQLAYNAGFKFVGSSPVNNNPKDTKDYPEGVWTLPPTLTTGETDRNRYLAIGESDRMTLKFVKPR